jgi:enediyne polyketide synthase
MDTPNPLADAAHGGSPIAIVGMGCWLPGAADPRHLWENVLARRREFRRMPDNRTPLADYYDASGQDPDRFYQSKVAVLDGFVFDWASYRVPESSYLRTDVCQWLALEIAHRAIQDAGFSRAAVPKDRTGVFIGNTCTGEGMRSNSLRLRWPVVHRALSKAGDLQRVPAAALAAFVKTAEDCYKSIFPDINEDFVAGSISATIAGRICNYFDFHGGAFVIDGACASSLATVVTAANMLASNDLDLALAGGIDVSLDPFELVGFSRNGALSKGEIRPYDRRGEGFIAGEGGGMVLLKRLEDAQRDGDAIYAVIRGWGIASDGRAGIMQPVASQQAAAISRAAARAGCKLQDLDFIEGHGTGTRAGDRTELEGLALAMAMEGAPSGAALARRCGIGSLKSLIGHTKATAGIASLIKAVAAVNRRVVPPTAGCDEPNEAFNGAAAHLFPIRCGEVHAPDTVMRAGVSAFGFGGINTHIIVESGGPPSSRLASRIDERALLVATQESELFVFGGSTPDELIRRVDVVAGDARLLSQSDLADLAAALAEELPPAMSVRAAVIAGTAEELAEKLVELRRVLESNSAISARRWVAPCKGVYVAKARNVGRIGFLFPGQGSQQLLMARSLVERFDWARQLAEEVQRSVPDLSLLELIYPQIDRARDPSQIDAWARALAATEVAQPAICFASVLCARFLLSLGIRPAVAGGHSLGELTALHAAGAFDAQTLFSIAALRGRLMRSAPDGAGAMASLACSCDEAEKIIAGAQGTVVIANINSPVQTVVSGDINAIDAVTAQAAARNIQCRRLPVSNAFHSPLVARAAEELDRALTPLSLPSMDVPVLSGVESVDIDTSTDVRRHLARQITAPVNFMALATRMRAACDVLIEVGPGRVLSGLCRDIFAADDVCIPLAADAMRWNPSAAVAVAFVNGVSVNWRELYAQRLVRPYTSPSKRHYLSNPAERPIVAPSVSVTAAASSAWTSGQSIEQAVGNELGVSEEILGEYLRRRGAFLAGVARLDMQSGAGGNSQAPLEPLDRRPEVRVAVSSREVPASGAAAKPTLVRLTELLVGLISKRTGYPASSITVESRLLDDLNLDSIKAGELVAEASRHIGVAGAIDATRFANSSIQAIARALHEAAPEVDQAVVEGRPQSQLDPVVVADGAPFEAVIEILLDLVSQRTGYPRSSMTAESRLLDDLNLDSIKAGEIVAAAARRLEVAGTIDATRFANSSLSEIAAGLAAVIDAKQPTPAACAPARPSIATQEPAPPRSEHDLSFTARCATWTRNFVVRAIAMPRGNEQSEPANDRDADLAGTVFLVLSDANDHELVDALCAEILARGGMAERASFDALTRPALQLEQRFTHQIAVLPRAAGEGAPGVRVAEMLARVTSLAKVPVKSAPARRLTTVAYVQFGGGSFASDGACEPPELCNALAFARTLHLERKDLCVRVLDFAKAAAPSFICHRVLEEIADGEAFAAVGFDSQLIRRVPFAELSNPATYRPRSIEWSARDVILVTGGAKGIMAECALGLARETGATLVLLGRGQPALRETGTAESEIERTLERFRAEGLRHLYVSCDIVDFDSLAGVVNDIEAQAGVITGVIHGASILRPCRTENLTVEGLLQEVSPKVLGAWNLCRVLRGKPLKLFVAISSLVVDHGMPWSAGYAFANEAMERILAAELADPPTPLQIVSFGLWGQVGRPAVLKTNDHLLSVGLHDGEIAPEEGVRRLVEALTLDPGTQRLCIYGRSVGYPTWGQLRPTPFIPANLRFIERILHVEPDVELIARCRLTGERDRYLQDHVYKGMYIVPTVFALEAIAQAASALVGGRVPLYRLDSVEMPVPIVVDPDRGLEIELRAEVQDASADGLLRIHVAVSTEQTGFRTHVLAGIVVFGSRRELQHEPIVPGNPVPIDARADLYGRQFFVGPLYQRMGAIYSVDPNKAICVGEIHSQEDAAREAFSHVAASTDEVLVLGDPFFRDTLLHSSLLHHLEHMAFTSRIDKIELFQGHESARTEQRLCVARLQWMSGKDAEYELLAVTMGGQVVERWTGFCTKALVRTETWPELQDLLSIDRTRASDERNLLEHIANAAKQIGVIAPTVVLECIDGFADLSIEERHVHERALAARAIDLVVPGRAGSSMLEWLSTGRPRLDAGTNLDISFSHEGWYCLCALGPDAQGCDIARISRRSQPHWHSLIGAARESLVAALSKEDPLDVAGTRIWAALEAARKALGGAEEELTVVKRVGGSVLFRARAQVRYVFILTVPMRFSHGPQSIVALTVRMAVPTDAASASITPPATRIVRDEHLGCEVLEHDFTVTWKECTSPGRKVMAACYVEWFHRTREAMLAPEDARRWVAGVIEGSTGLVARSIRVRVHGEVTAHDEVVARIWMTQLSESGARWRADFFHRLPDGVRRLVAIVEAEGGVVATGKTGSRLREEPNAIRDYGRFVETQPSVAQVASHSGFDELQRGVRIFEMPAGPRRGPLVFVETLRPSLIDSDLVGNVSSITFFRWLAQVRDVFLHSVAPGNMARRVGTTPDSLGEAICVDEEMVYLREAFPFDDLRVEMTLVAATERSVRFRYEFVRRKHGASEKIAIGHQQLLWVCRDVGQLCSQNFPSELLAILTAPPVAEQGEMPQAMEAGE